MRGVIGGSLIGWYFIVLSFLMLLFERDEPWALLKYYLLIVIASLMIHFLKLKIKIIDRVADEISGQANDVCFDKIYSALLATKNDMSFSIAYACWLPFILFFDYVFNTFNVWYSCIISLLIIIAIFTYIFKLELINSARKMINAALIEELKLMRS